METRLLFVEHKNIKISIIESHYIVTSISDSLAICDWAHCFNVRLIHFFFNFKVFQRNLTEIKPLELAKMTFLKHCDQATILCRCFPSLQLDSPLTVVVIL